eukprot:s902_g21.t1
MPKKEKKEKKEKKQTKKDMRGKRERKSSSSDSSSSNDADVQLTHTIAASFGLKPNACQIHSKIFKIGDLKPYLLALILSRQHTNLNEQSLMVMGGELYEIRKRGLQNMRLSDTSDSLQMKLAMTKELQSAEKRWRDRLLQILSKVAGMDDYSVIGQHSSLTSLRRAVAAEVHQRMQDEETKMSWNVELKQLCSNLRQEAKTDMDNMLKQQEGRVSTSPTRASSSKKKEKDRKKPKGSTTKPRKSRKSSDDDDSSSSPSGYGSLHVVRAKKKREDKDTAFAPEGDKRFNKRGRMGDQDNTPDAALAGQSLVPEEKIHLFLKQYMANHFKTINDQSLFIKMISADGIESVTDFMDAVESGWQPTSEWMGAAAREVHSCLSWAGKQSALFFTAFCKDNLEAWVVEILACSLVEKKRLGEKDPKNVNVNQSVYVTTARDYYLGTY